MTRTLVVEGKAVAGMADLDQAALEVDPAHRRIALDRWGTRWRIGRLQRIERQHVLGIHQDQLLMLLLVIEAELEQRMPIAAVPLDQVDRGLGDMATIGQDLLDAGTRDHAALRARMARPDGLVVGVEEIFVGRIVDAIVARVRAQQEGLEEPRRVCEMPLGRAGVGHRLHGLVFRRQRSSELLAERANRQEAVDVSSAVRLHGWRYQVRHDTSAPVPTPAKDSRLQWPRREHVCVSLNCPQPRGPSADLRNRPVANSIFRARRLPGRCDDPHRG